MLRIVFESAILLSGLLACWFLIFGVLNYKDTGRFDREDMTWGSIFAGSWVAFSVVSIIVFGW